MRWWERAFCRVVLGPDPWNQQAVWLRFINAMDFVGLMLASLPTAFLMVYVHWSAGVGWLIGVLGATWRDVCKELRRSVALEGTERS